MAQAKHLLLTILGSYTASGDSPEKWQTGVRLNLDYAGIDPIGTLPDTWDPKAATLGGVVTDYTTASNWLIERSLGVDFDPVDYLINQVDPALRTWINGLPHSCSSVRVDELKLFPIGAPTGHAVPAPPYAVGSPATLVYTGFIPRGATNAAMLPPQNSVVASHRSAQLGRRGRGRMFLPPLLQAAVGSDGRLASGVNASVASVHGALLEGISIGSGVPATWNVRPIVTGSPWGNYAVVNSVQVGDVMDTQRRRRRQLVEARAAYSPSYP